MFGLKSPVGILKIHPTHTHLCTPVHTPAYTHSNQFTRVHTHTPRYNHIHPNTTCADPQTHRNTPMHIRIHLNTPTHACEHLHTCKHPHILVHSPNTTAHALNLMNHIKSYINRSNTKTAERRKKERKKKRRNKSPLRRSAD